MGQAGWHVASCAGAAKCAATAAALQGLTTATVSAALPQQASPGVGAIETLRRKGWQPVHATCTQELARQAAQEQHMAGSTWQAPHLVPGGQQQLRDVRLDPQGHQLLLIARLVVAALGLARHLEGGKGKQAGGQRSVVCCRTMHWAHGASKCRRRGWEGGYSGSPELQWLNASSACMPTASAAIQDCTARACLHHGATRPARLRHTAQVACQPACSPPWCPPAASWTCPSQRRSAQTPPAWCASRPACPGRGWSPPRHGCRCDTSASLAAGAGRGAGRGLRGG
jgi:hypothetical protein